MSAGGGGNKGQVNDIALRVTAADSVGSIPDVDHQIQGPLGPADGERSESLQQGKPGVLGGDAVRSDGQPPIIGQDPFVALVPTVQAKGHDGVPVVEGI